MAKHEKSRTVESTATIVTCWVEGNVIPHMLPRWKDMFCALKTARFDIKETGKSEAGHADTVMCRACIDAVECLDVYRTIMKVFGMRRWEEHFDGPHGVQYFALYHNLSVENRMIEYFKWKNSNVMAWALDQPLVASPLWADANDRGHVMFRGGAYAFLVAKKRDLGKNNRQAREDALSFFNALLMAKRGLPRPDEEDLREATIKAQQQLTSPCEYGGPIIGFEFGDDDYDEDVSVTYAKYDINFWQENPTTDEKMKSLSDRIVKVVRGLNWNKLSAEEWNNLECETFSANSHIDSKTREGGAKGLLFERVISQDPTRPTKVGVMEKEDESEDVVRILGRTGNMLSTETVEVQKAWAKRETLNRVASNRCVDGWVGEEMEDDVSCVYEDEKVKMQCILLQRELVAQWTADDSKAKVHALAEALKIRTITLGPSRLYSALLPVMHMMFRTLRADKRFCVGGPILPEKISEILGNLLCGEKWLSGDYKAATDNLNAYLTSVCAEAIAGQLNMPDAYKKMFHAGLTGHQIALTTFKGRKEEIIGYQPQRSGQLMGSPVSFPILCIINFAVIWESYCVANGEIPFKSMKAIVNGDDCLFAANLGMKDAWEDLAKTAGLTPSVGKTYWSEDVMVINSMLLDYKLSVPFFDLYGNVKYLSKVMPDLNFGILNGVHRDGSRSTMSSRSAYSQDASERCVSLLRGFPSATQVLLMDEFIKRNGNAEVSSTLPWFLPKDLGGYGLPCVLSCTADMDIDQPLSDEIVLRGPKEHDRRRAAYLIDKINEELARGVDCENIERLERYLPPNMWVGKEKTEWMECMSEFRKMCGLVRKGRNDRDTSSVGNYSWRFIRIDNVVKEGQKAMGSDEKMLIKFWQKIDRRPEVFSYRNARMAEILNFKCNLLVPAVRVVRRGKESAVEVFPFDDESKWFEDLGRSNNYYSLFERVQSRELRGLHPFGWEQTNYCELPCEATRLIHSAEMRTLCARYASSQPV